MQELALYRKYRPQKWSEVRGQDHIVDVLADSIDSGKVSHAYLFVGSRGTGKTSVARIFAREMGISVNDLYEIDAASNRGIEDIKELREGARVLPFDSKYKIYIIDEVHMLSKDAWGALLKTLEEPPKHVIFILATTELQKVPETIISRCQVFTFKKPTDSVLKDLLIEIAGKEKYKLDTQTAELIALLGDGSFRDAQGVLQKVLNFSKEKTIKKIDVEQITGSPKSVLVNDFLSALIGKDIDKGFQVINRVVSDNLDIKLFSKLIIQKLRTALVLRYAPKFGEEVLEGLSENDAIFLKELLKKDTGIIRSQTLVSLLKTFENMDNVFVLELPLQIFLVETIGDK